MRHPYQDCRPNPRRGPRPGWDTSPSLNAHLTLTFSMVSSMASLSLHHRPVSTTVMHHERAHITKGPVKTGPCVSATVSLINAVKPLLSPQRRQDRLSRHLMACATRRRQRVGKCPDSVAPSCPPAHTLPGVAVAVAPRSASAVALAEANLLGKLATLLRIARRNHRIIIRQPPAAPVFFRCHIVGGS